ncbi:MAG: matrixin family metalloprotease [Acidobacteria bacterium]|nr:matrixin family metalloprotease [Acidobacteriota bacterium]
MLMRRKVTGAWALVWLLAGVCPDAAAYQTYGVEIGGRVVVLKWRAVPVRYYVSGQSVPGVSAAELQGAVQRAFATWQGVAEAAVAAQFVGLTPAEPFDDDGASTLGFLSRPDLDRVLGATDFVIDKTTGEIIESDIFFNSAFSWSVAPGGETGKFDLESIALHEIGHFFGLGHSALGETELRPGGGRRVIAAEAVMFPIAFSPGNTSGRTLRADDRAGMSELYPASTTRQTTGMIVGTVTKNGQGVFGAHVVAFNPGTGALVAGFTLDRTGRFAIGGLSPGPHILRVEPLDDADLDSFFDDTSGVDLAFLVTFAQRFGIAPRGGASDPVVVHVTPK